MMSFIVAALLLPNQVHAAPRKTNYEICIEQCLAWMDTPSAARNQCFARCSIVNGDAKVEFMNLMNQAYGMKALMKQTFNECETYEDCDQDDRGSTDMDGNENEPSEPGPDDTGSDF